MTPSHTLCPTCYPTDYPYDVKTDNKINPLDLIKIKQEIDKYEKN